MRADARRNRQRLLAAALQVFAEQGADDASLDEIAKPGRGRHRHPVPALPDPARRCSKRCTAIRWEDCARWP